MESNIFLAAQPLTAAMFVIGFIIFVLYMVGYLYMINTAHKQQRREQAMLSVIKDPDDIDYDGIGNQGRFPNKHKIKESNAKVLRDKTKRNKRKAATKSKMYI